MHKVLRTMKCCLNNLAPPVAVSPSGGKNHRFGRGVTDAGTAGRADASDEPRQGIQRNKLLLIIESLLCVRDAALRRRGTPGEAASPP